MIKGIFIGLFVSVLFIFVISSLGAFIIMDASNMNPATWSEKTRGFSVMGLMVGTSIGFLIGCINNE